MASREYQALESALSLASPPATAAVAFTRSSTMSFKERKLEESQLEAVWETLIDFAARTPHEHQAPLAETVSEIQKLNLSAEENGRKYDIWGEKLDIWTDMPLLGPALRDAWNKAPGSDSNSEFSPDQWTNINAFVARLTAISPSKSVLDFSLYAIWTLRLTLEETEDVEIKDLSSARVWFLYAKDVLEKLSKDLKTFDGNMAKPGYKFKEKDWRGFTLERLEIWRAALQ